MIAQLQLFHKYESSCYKIHHCSNRSYFALGVRGKGQNVENHFIESQKKNIESLKFEKDQNVKSIFRTSKV
jgi:hypothetical protein